jgi:hypothetical protein
MLGINNNVVACSEGYILVFAFWNQTQPRNTSDKTDHMKCDWNTSAQAYYPRIRLERLNKIRKKSEYLARQAEVRVPPENNHKALPPSIM